jgi:hypothetical protein
MAHQGDVAACPHRLPGIGRVIGAGDLYRAAEAEQNCEDDKAHAAHGGGSRKSRRSSACSTLRRKHRFRHFHGQGMPQELPLPTAP